MSGYTIRYPHADGVKKIRAAINDTREYLGDHRWRLIVSTFFTHEGFTAPLKTQKAAMACLLTFAGVRGFPVRAMWAFYLKNRRQYRLKRRCPNLLRFGARPATE